MKKILPLTYAPKIPGVLNGTIRQTIRKGRKLQVGDLIASHGWEGKPYRSKWSFRTGYFELTQVIDCEIKEWGIKIPPDTAFGWKYKKLNILARLDGIDPPTGEALRDVLLSMGCLGQAQIVRW
jgi:hypothetical protein